MRMRPDEMPGEAPGTGAPGARGPVISPGAGADSPRRPKQMPGAQPGRGLGGLFTAWTTRELVVAAVLSVAVGVIFWAWGLLWTAAFSLIPFPFQYGTVGLWMMGGLLVPYIVRRPGAAFFAEVVAAFVSMALGNQWGILTMASGLVQGAGAELVFAAYGWKRFTGPALYGAAALAGVFSIALDTFVYGYYSAYTWTSILVAAIFCVVSSVVLGGLLSQLLAEALAKTGVLAGLQISKGKVKRI
jgi:energy-coupling factor transport system permease protein